jgi:D-3-phosphoglycerate dehydrogenase
MKKILVIQPLRPEALALFDQRKDVTYEVVTDFTPANLLAKVVDADAITVRDAPLPVEVLAAAPRLRIVSRHGVGYDNIPVAYCTERAIPVTVVGDVNAISVAEHAIYLILSAARFGIELDEAVRRNDFGARARLVGMELKGRTLVLVGYGRIGRETARRAQGLGMEIVVHDPFAVRADHPGTRFVDRLEEALAMADVLSLHIPLSDKTRNLIDARALALMPKGSIVINTARGGIIDEVALVASLEGGHTRAAGLDVFAVEPLPLGSPILSSKRVVLTPHSAALTEQSLIGMGLMTARNALAGLDGALDPNLVVNRAVLGIENHA